MSTTQSSAGLRLVRAVGPYLAAFSVMAGASGLAGAAAPEPPLEILPPDQYIGFGTGYVTPGDRPAQYGIGFNASYAHRVSGANWVEAQLFENVYETGSDSKPDFYASGIGLDYERLFGGELESHFFGLLGAGVAANSASPYASGTSWFGDVGIGFKGTIWQEWGVRPRIELRYVHDSIAQGSNDIVLGLRLEVPPKRRKVVERLVEVEKKVEVPVEVEKIVEKQVACVVPAVTAPAAPMVDTDQDGIPDDKDSCPNTLKGAKVDEKGCVKEEQKISLPNIEFESGRTVLAKGSKGKLESVVQFLSSQRDLQVDVFGHTDSQGKDEFNLKLSEGRARTVMEYLVSRGIDAKRLSSKGFGETQPIADNETAEGRAQNRRVELLIRTQK